ncbi:MAG: hypothetical protein JWP00_1019 [Chloroflexi bacterium]|nr:hypothetical protein [Chloroflexota bacterium]
MTETSILTNSLPALDRAHLTPLVRELSGSNSLEILDWQINPIKFTIVNPITAGLFRISGTAQENTTISQWSMVLKILHPSAELPEKFWGSVNSAVYLKRELLVYRSELKASLPAGLEMPRLLGVLELPDNTEWLWIEDIIDCYPSGWPLERYGLAGRHLGLFNGRYLTGLPLPDYAWLTRQFLRGWVGFFTDAPRMQRVRDPATWDKLLVRAAFPTPIGERFLNLVAKSDLLIDMVERLPQVFCHMDANCGNLLARRDAEGHDQTVLIDWALTGLNGVGCELGQLIWGAIPNRVLNRDAGQLESLAFENYMAGLHEAGWSGDATIVRFGYLAYLFCVLGILRMGRCLDLAFDEAQHAILEEKQHRPITGILADEGETVCSLVVRGEEAFRLLDTVSAML